MKSKLKTILFALLFISAGMLVNSFYYSAANNNDSKFLFPEPQGQDAWKEIPADTARAYTDAYNPKTDDTLKGVNLPNDVLQKILSDYPNGVERIYLQFAIEKGGADVVFCAEPKNKNERKKYYMSTLIGTTCPRNCPLIQ